MKKMERLLEVKNLKISFYTDHRQITVVDDACFFINTNSVLGMVGESGCGKTMTALSITRLLPKRNCKIDSGSVNFSGSDLLKLNEAELRLKRGKEISYVFQEPSTSLNPVLTIREQLAEVIRLHRKDIQDDFVDDFMIRLLKDMGMHQAEEKINSYPHQLSGGEKQRVMIAMAMSSRPKLLIADEPTTALDVTIQAQILCLLEDLKNKFGLSILFISHDLNLVGQLSDYIAVMYAGEIVEFSKAEYIINEPDHPYTQGLFDCLPERYIGKSKKLKVISGDVPKAGSFPVGCRFNPRCPKAFDRCYQLRPPLFKLEKNKEVRCWLYSDFPK